MRNFELGLEQLVEQPAPAVNQEIKKPATKKKKSVEEVNKAVENKKKREAELRLKLEIQIKEQLEIELKPKLKAEVEAELTEKLEVKLRSAIEQELGVEFKPNLKAEFEAELKDKLEVELRSTIEQELEQQLKSKLTAELEAGLTEKIEIELRSTIEQEIEVKLKQQLKAEKLVGTIPKPETTVETKSDTELESANPIEFDMETKHIIEAILFAAEKPMTSKQIRNVYPELERPELKEIQVAIDSIVVDYESRAIVLKQLASGYRFQVKEDFSFWVSRLFEEKPPRYSRALLETIAIIAYRQPVTRGDIEDIRGVSVSSNIIRTLLDREWVRIIAHKEVPGRPALYGTTKQFLDYFNVSSLEQLPPLEEIKDLDFSSGNPLSPGIPQKNEQNLSQENITEKKSIEEQTSEEQTTEKPQDIEPISETRH